MTSAVRAIEPLRLQDDDLLDLLRPRTVAIAVALSVIFAVASLHGLGKPLVLALVGVGSIISVCSPCTGFVLCVFLFAFRNEAFAIGPLKAADPLFAVTVVSWTIHALLQNKLRLHYSILPVAVYMAAGILSGLGAQCSNYYGPEAVRLAYIVIIYLLALQMMGSRKTLLACVKAFCAAGLVMAICAAIGFLSHYVLHGPGDPFLDSGGRFGMQSIAVDPLRVSSFLIFPMLVMAGLQQRARTSRERRIATVLFWLGMLGCALSVSRSAVLQVVPGLLVMWLLTGRHLQKILLLVGVMAVFLAAVTFVSEDNPLVKEYGLDRWAVAGQLAADRTEPREIIWHTGLKVFDEYPILGVGLDNFRARYFEFRDPWETSGWIYYQQKANHSTYMGALTETGLVGLACMLMMMGYFVVLGRRVVRLARKDQDRPRYLLAAAALGAFVGQLLAGIALDLMSHNHVWIIMAVLAVLDRPRGRVPAQTGPVLVTNSPAPTASGTPAA